MSKLGTHHACAHALNKNTCRHVLPSGEKVVVCRRCKTLKQYAKRQKWRANEEAWETKTLKRSALPASRRIRIKSTRSSAPLLITTEVERDYVIRLADVMHVIGNLLVVVDCGGNFYRLKMKLSYKLPKFDPQQGFTHQWKLAADDLEEQSR